MSKNNWSPFFALANTRGGIDKTIESRNDILQPVLTEETLYEMQDVLLESLESNSSVIVSYYENKRVLSISGVVSKIDVYNKSISICGVKIPFNKLVSVASV